jgi:DNA-binding transcriptional regulator YdaS (Cro superfamily)
LRCVTLATSQRELVRRLQKWHPNVTRAHLYNWLNGADSVVSGEYCRALSAAVDGQVTVHELRPDVFGPPPESWATWACPGPVIRAALDAQAGEPPAAEAAGRPAVEHHARGPSPLSLGIDARNPVPLDPDERVLLGLPDRRDC